MNCPKCNKPAVYHSTRQGNHDVWKCGVCGLFSHERDHAVALTASQLAILHHTVHRAAQGLFCGGSPDMDFLVEHGLMLYAGKKSFVPDPYYSITSKGRTMLRARQSNAGAGRKEGETV